MAKQDVTVRITFEYDPEVGGMPAHIYLFKFLNALDREYPVKSVLYKGKTKTFRAPGALVKDVALRKVDSVSDADLPTPPAWLKDRIVLKGVNVK
jgi:hypothetical protein